MGQGERLFFLQPPDVPQSFKKKKKKRKEEDKKNKIGLSRFNNTTDTHHQSRFYPKADFVKASFLVAPHTLTNTPNPSKGQQIKHFATPISRNSRYFRNIDT